MRERLRWQRYVLRMKDDRVPKIALVGQPSRTKQKACRPRIGWVDVVRKDLRKMRASWECVKSEALNRLGRRRSVHSCVGACIIVCKIIKIVHITFGIIVKLVDCNKKVESHG